MKILQFVNFLPVCDERRLFINKCFLVVYSMINMTINKTVIWNVQIRMPYLKMHYPRCVIITINQTVLLSLNTTILCCYVVADIGWTFTL